MPEPKTCPDSGSIFSALEAVIADRKTRSDGERSYVASLLQAGLPKIGAKIQEEAAEVVEAADEPGDAGRDHLVHEVADLFFHILVLLGYREIPIAEIKSELTRRFGVSGVTEKAMRRRDPAP